MKEREDKRASEANHAAGDTSGRESLEKALGDSLAGSGGAGERRTLSGAARELAKLPAETARAAIEVSAALAGVSLRVAMEFLRAVPEAAHTLGADELRAWGEVGRRLAMADVETGAQFFATGAGELSTLPREARLGLLQVTTRQMALSTSIALETLRRAGELARTTDDARTLHSVIEVAQEIARRSAKHSADFLAATPRAVETLHRTETRGSAPSETSAATNERPTNERATNEQPTNDGATDEQPTDEQVTDEQSKNEQPASVVQLGVRVAGSFAERAGGMAADFWAALPSTLAGLSAGDARRLLDESERMLEYGGAASLHALVAGGEVLRLVPEAFAGWTELLREVAAHGNASLVALARATPAFFQTLAKQSSGAWLVSLSVRIIEATRGVARTDSEAAISCFRSAPPALRATTIEQFERWALEGLARTGADQRARRSYYALETRQSHEALQTGVAGLALDDVSPTLRLYVEALTGRAVEIAPLASVPVEARINDGRTIHLPSNVSEFDSDALNFSLYKVLAAHAAGQIEFGTHERDRADLRAAYTAIAEAHAPENLDARDAFALDGYINDLANSEPALAPAEEARRAELERAPMPAGSDYRAALALFPQAGLAARIFGTLENGRVDRRLRQTYRGLARDLNRIREHLRGGRPRIASLPITLVPFELLFQITLCGGALEDARSFYAQIVSELETIVADYLVSPQSTVADTLMATSRVYSLFQSVVPDMQEQAESETQAASAGEEAGEEEATETGETVEQPEPQTPSEQKRDARELFNAWASAEAREAEPDDLFGAERWTESEGSEQELEEGEVAYAYDEWDRELSDMRVGWCRVVEKRVRRGERSFVELTRARYRGVISSIRHQFQLMKPESLKRVTNELDGDDFDLNAVIDYVLDRRADGQQSERLYTRRLRRERDVAVSFLLDQSSSTARTIGRHPLQPYTHPGRRIIEIEKEGLVLMSEALEAVGDVYAIYGFTSEGRRNVKFYVVKDFDEHYSEEIERRIGGINYQHNTRLGAAVRHAAERLKRQEARTRLLVVLSDGRPYDHDYGDARYAREDTRAALQQARTDGITPFCITIDRDSETELRDLYGEVGYTIIDDVLSLPERLPAIYRRLTT